MTRGIVFIAFGKEYDRLAAYTLALSKPFIKCSVTVITNLKERDNKWNDVSNIEFLFVDLPDDRNREVKTQLYKYSPYDETLYCDCDCVFVREGIEKIFDRFGQNDLILQLNKFECWTENKRYFKIYRDTAMAFGLSLPLCIYQGAIFAFRKTNEISAFFDKWYLYWQKTGCGRDMPSLACAVKKSGVLNSQIKIDDNFFVFGNNTKAIVYHPVRDDALSKQYGIPAWKPDKLFDRNRKQDWSLVFFDDEKNSIINHPWVKKKFDKTERISRKNKYVAKYLPEIENGGMKILDVATGPGEFIEIAKSKGNDAIGVDFCSGMIGREIDTLYERFNLIMHKEKNLPVIYADFKSVILDGHRELDGKKFDVINCEWAINFIFREVFDSHPERGEYKNDGNWIFSDRFEFLFQSYLNWCHSHSNSRAIVMIAALHATNAQEYSDRIVNIAAKSGFSLVQSDKNLNHKFRKAA